MNLDEVIEGLPSYAKDLKLNFSSVVRQQTELNGQQLWGTVVASRLEPDSGVPHNAGLVRLSGTILGEEAARDAPVRRPSGHESHPIVTYALVPCAV